MIHIFKNLNFGGLIALALGVVLMVSWKSVETKLTTTNWYQVELKENGDPNELEDFEIRPTPITAPAGDCDQLSGEMICAIQLTFDPTETSLPTTVAEAHDDLDVVVDLTQYYEED